MLTFEMLLTQQNRVKEIEEIITKEPSLSENYIKEMEARLDIITLLRDKMWREMYDRQMTIEVGKKFKFEFTLSDN